MDPHNQNQRVIKGIKLERLLEYSVFAGGFSFIVIYLWVVISRINYPFELEWIEGGVLGEVQRVVQGLSIYISPSVDFVPFLYPPGYFYLSAGVSNLIGGGFFPLRLVSFLASLVSFVTIFLIVNNETKNRKAAFFATCLFAASFRVTGAWLDIARVDSLFLMLFLLVILFIQNNDSLTRPIIAGIFAALAILTKQTALILCLPIAIFLFYRNWRQALCFLGSAGLFVGAVTILMDRNTQGWYSYYVYDLLGQQTQWMPLEFVRFWKNDLIIYLPIGILLSIYFLGEIIRREKTIGIKWLLILAGAVAGTFLSRVKIGGYDNVLLPAYAILSILAGLGLAIFVQKIQTLQEDQKRKAVIFIQLACLIQLIVLSYNPFVQIPSKRDLTEGNKVIEFLSQQDMSIYIPDHGYLLSLVGQKAYAHHAAIWDVMRTDLLTEGKLLLAENLEDSIRRQVFDMIIMDEGGNFCCREIEIYYSKAGDLFDDHPYFYPVTGDKRRPAIIYTANRLK